VAGTDDEPLWSALIPGPLKVPLAIYRHRKLIQRVWKHLGVWTKLGPTDIVVTGRPGVGKSMLLHVLNKASADLDFENPDLSREVESSVLQVADQCEIARVIPGQLSQQRAVGLNRALLHNKQLKGVIHVVDWGYTAERDAEIRRGRIEKDKIDTIEKIRSLNLAAEIADFRDTCSKIESAKAEFAKPDWLLIVVNKVDLFMSDIDAAQTYYSPSMESDFTAPLHDLMGRIGRNNLRCAALPVFVWDDPFEWNGHRVPSLGGGFGNSKVLLRALMARLSSISQGT
jgi:50S ribosome-binding GTPase